VRSDVEIFGFSFGGSSEKKLMSELNEYYKIAEESPDDARVHLRIAEVLMKMGKRGKAIEEYTYAAEAYEANNLSQISSAIYKQILQIDPSQVNVYQTLIDLYIKEGFLGDAVAIYESLANYYHGRGMQDEAIKTLDKMVAIDPDSVYVKSKIDRFYSEKQVEPQAVESKSPDEEWKLFNPVTGGKKHDQQPLKQEQREFYDLETMLQDDFLTEEDMPQELEGMEAGEASSKLGFDRIFKEIQQSESEKHEQSDSLLYYNLGSAFQKVGRFDEAIEEIKKALEDPKREADCYLRLAVCSREKDSIDDALKYLKKGLRTKNLSESKMIELKYEMALAYKKKRKMKKAMKIFQQIHEINSTFRDVSRELD